jgi:hypothetical protein
VFQIRPSYSRFFIHVIGMKGQYAHTSEFLELVSVPTAPCFSMRTELAPSLDCSFRAMASPTAPAPTIACVKSARRGALVENNLV